LRDRPAPDQPPSRLGRFASLQEVKGRLGPTEGAVPTLLSKVASATCFSICLRDGMRQLAGRSAKGNTKFISTKLEIIELLASLYI
jgi:hypothetical protein